MECQTTGRLGEQQQKWTKKEQGKEERSVEKKKREVANRQFRESSQQEIKEFLNRNRKLQIRDLLKFLILLDENQNTKEKPFA